MLGGFTTLSTAGEPVPGAEIFLELEPDDEPIIETEDFIDFLDINLERSSILLGKHGHRIMSNEVNELAMKIRSTKLQLPLEKLKNTKFKRLPKHLGKKNMTVACYLFHESSNMLKAMNAMLKANPRNKLAIKFASSLKNFSAKLRAIAKKNGIPCKSKKNPLCFHGIAEFEE